MSGAAEDDDDWDAPVHCTVCGARDLQLGCDVLTCEYGCERTFCNACVPGHIFCCCDGLCTHSGLTWVVRRVHRKLQHAL
jgi:hypothetical protein